MTKWKVLGMPLTVTLSLSDLLQVESHAAANGMSETEWVEALIMRALYRQDHSGHPLPVTTMAYLQAVAEEWLIQLPVGIRRAARQRIAKRSQGLSDEQRRWLLP